MNNPAEQAVQPIPFQYHSMDVRAMTGPDGEPRFVAADVAEVLGYDRWTNMVRMLEEDERGAQIVSTPGGPQQMAVLTESGLFHAILKSRRPEASAFRKWVTAEVLPSIRKTGSYGLDLSRMPSDQLLSMLHQASAAGLEQQHRAEVAEEQVRKLEPRAAVTDHLVRVTDGQTVTAVAKELVGGHAG